MEKSYKNNIEDYDHRSIYDPRSIEVWKIADQLEAELAGTTELDHWNGYGEGYSDLRKVVATCIARLRAIY